jgi:hypothetical protein
MLDFTHDPKATSWVASAQAAGCDFTIQNLPHGVFARIGAHEPPRGGVAIGDQVLDLAKLASLDFLDGEAQVACEVAGRETLNAFMGLGLPAWRSLRRALFRVLSSDADKATQDKVRACLVPLAQAEMKLPVDVRNYTDFYTSVHHATNVGKIARPGQPAHAQLQVAAHRLPRPCHQRGAQRHRLPPAQGPGQAARRQRTGVRALQAARLRARDGLLRRARDRARPADPAGRGARPHLRHVPAQRLVGARPPVLGDESAGPVPGQELLHQHLALGGLDGCAGAVPRGVRTPGRRSAAAGLPGRCGRHGRPAMDPEESELTRAAIVGAALDLAAPKAWSRSRCRRWPTASACPRAACSPASARARRCRRP